MPLQEKITRRNLPHWYVAGAMHFVTYRLAGTIPLQVLVGFQERKRKQRERPPPEGISLGQHRQLVNKRFFADYDRYLDRTCKIDWLAQPAIAALIRGNLYHHNGGKYHLFAYCVMPNHVHVLIQPIEEDSHVRPLVSTSPAVAASQQARPLAATADQEGGELEDATSPLASIMHSLKSYTAHQANELLERSGPFWQHESYDHWVRNDEELERIVDYIAWNPVKAELVKEPHLWFFGSAHDRFLLDGSKVGYLG